MKARKEEKINMIKFSEKLINETIQIFKEEDGVEFTQEQAEEALENLLGLYLSFAKNNIKID
jgi:hypothetical protein